MKYLWILLLLCSGCVDMFTAKTQATYTISPDGKTISYISNKEQQGLKLHLEEVNGKPTVVDISVDKADTQQEAIAAALQTQLGLQQIIKGLLDKAAQGGK
jgi:membrane-anchored protein YejM (alkaline phosphatase superfamily)